MDEETLFIYLKDKKMEKIRFECYKGYYFIHCRIADYDINLTNVINSENHDVYPLHYDSTKNYTINDFEYTSIYVNNNFWIDKQNIIY